MIPSTLSRLPLIWVRSSSVSFPHCCFTAPFTCFQFPSRRFQSMVTSFMQRTNVVLAILFQTAVVGDLRRRRYRPFASRRTELSGPTGVCVGVRRGCRPSGGHRYGLGKRIAVMADRGSHSD